jgi:uncharacterized RDD family membrane protein YckC
MIEPVERAGCAYLVRRGAAALLDYGSCAAAFISYYRLFGEVTAEGSYKVEGCHHLLILLAVWTILLPVPEARWGCGFGKFMLELRVRSRETGGPPGIGAALKRAAAAVAEIAMCGGLLAVAVIVSTRNRQRLGDLWADTVVIFVDEHHGPGPDSPPAVST